MGHYSRLIKFLVNTIRIYDIKLIYYENTLSYLI